MKDLWMTALAALLFVGIAVGGSAGFVWLLNADAREMESKRQECLSEVHWDGRAVFPTEVTQEDVEHYLDAYRQYCNDAYGRNR